LSRGGNAAGQLNRVANERAAGRINSTAAYSKADIDFSAMAASSHGNPRDWQSEKREAQL
jgi:hypothetical protein